MPEDSLVRAERLVKLLDARHIAPRNRARYLMDTCGSTIAYWSGLLAGDRSFGERKARRVEEGLDLPPRYLDQESFSVGALEIAAIFDKLDTHGRAVLRATAHALATPGNSLQGNGVPPPDLSK